ncbi:MAG TPA: TRAP transporter small permease [Xanthobacteraceae bacterium]|nr:TRAP transporter small permease [Xanthobacteraceae bacterium]
MIDVVLRGVRALVAVLRLAAGVLLAASVLVNFANVIGRYFFGYSIYWAEEVMLFLMVGCVFLGNGVVAWSGRQIRMDVVVGKMPAKIRKGLDTFADLVFIATTLTIMVWAWPVIINLYEFDERSQSADIPMCIPQGLIPVGLAIMALLVAVRLVTGPGRATPTGPGAPAGPGAGSH